jgi:hypothetical protein
MKRKHLTPDIQTYKGKFRLPVPIPVPVPRISRFYKSNKKVVVFDLDETLGSFGDLYLLWSGIQHILPKYSDFFGFTDIYPEFLRYGIVSILQFIYEKKQKGECYKIYIYTNNQCPKAWVQSICDYFQYKLKIPTNNKPVLFDQIIRAFKIGNKCVELSRTSHQKIHHDLISCTLLPKSTEICFIDDMEFSQMKQDKVYYIRPRPYLHGLSLQEILDRMFTFFRENMNMNTSSNPELLFSKEYWYDWFLLNRRKDIVYSKNDFVEMEISKKMMFSIKEFFILTTYYENKLKNKTRKQTATMKSPTNKTTLNFTFYR